MFQENKDFDINNLYLNLTFHNSTETFEYRNPLLDHPSNYQLIVTKFLSKVNLPLLYLDETKKSNNTSDENIFMFDAYVRAEFTVADSALYPTTHSIKKNIFLWRDENDYETTSIAKTLLMPYTEEFGKYIDRRKEYGQKSTTPVSVYWYKNANYNYVYSPQQIIEMINNAIIRLYRECQSILMKDDAKDKVFQGYINKMGKQVIPYFLSLENDRVCLKIHGSFARLASRGQKYFYTEQESDSCNRYFRFSFSPNLKRFLKGLPGTYDKDGYFCPTVSYTHLIFSKREWKEFNNVRQLYFVIEGEKISAMEWSDYIGIAVTSTDFPVVGQIFPHFIFDNDSLENRRRYVSLSERNIGGFASPGSNTKVMEAPKEENIQSQNKTNVKINVLFVKYFNATDDLHHINYENNNVQTALKMDIMRTMPLLKFTLSLWLIDRFNNLEELRINKYNDEVVIMQLLLQRIKGDEKENRSFIDVVERVPPTIVQPVEGDDEQEQMINFNPETFEMINEILKPKKKKKKKANEAQIDTNEEEENGLKDLY